MATTITTNGTSAIDMTALMNLISEGKAFIVIPSAEDMTKFTNLQLVVDNTKKANYNRDKALHTILNKYLNEYGIEHISGKGAKKGVVRDKTYNFLYDRMKEKQGFKVKETLSALHEAGYVEEGRGLKYDIVTGVYDAMPSYNRRVPYQIKAKNHIVLKLKELPLTNNFAQKFEEYLAQ